MPLDLSIFAAHMQVQSGYRAVIVDCGGGEGGGGDVWGVAEGGRACGECEYGGDGGESGCYEPYERDKGGGREEK